MSNSQIFFWPGEVALAFILSLFDMHPAQLDATSYSFFSFMCALVVWSWIAAATIAIVKKIFGFEQRGR